MQLRGRAWGIRCYVPSGPCSPAELALALSAALSLHPGDGEQPHGQEQAQSVFGHHLPVGPAMAPGPLHRLAKLHDINLTRTHALTPRKIHIPDQFNACRPRVYQVRDRSENDAPRASYLGRLASTSQHSG